MEPSDAETLSVDSGTLPLKSLWRGQNPTPNYYDELSDVFDPSLADELTKQMKSVVDADIMSILRRTVQDDVGEDGTP